MRGVGDSLSDADQRERRMHLWALERAVYGGWDIPDNARKDAPAFLVDLANDPSANTRNRIRAIEVLAALSRDRVDATVQLDRIYRLDDGTATDRVEVVSDMPDSALEAVARSIVSSPHPALPSPECVNPITLPKLDA